MRPALKVCAPLTLRSVFNVIPDELSVTKLNTFNVCEPLTICALVPLKVTVPPVAVDVPLLVQLPFTPIVAVPARANVPVLVTFPFIVIVGEHPAILLKVPPLMVIRSPEILITGVPVDAVVKVLLVIITFPFTVSDGEFEQVYVLVLSIVK